MNLTQVPISMIDTVAGDAGKVLTSDGSTLNWVASSSVGTVITQGAAVTLTNQTSVNFTGIPSTAKRITVIFGEVSTSGSSLLQVQIGSGSVTTAGYKSTATAGTNNANSTTGFLACNTMLATYSIFGSMTINLFSGYTYVASGSTGLITSSPINAGSLAGIVTLSNVLDRVRLTTVNGTDLLDAGTVNIMWE